VLAILVVSITAQAGDHPIVGRWLFPMDQEYVFKNDGTLSRGYNGQNYGTGNWKFVRMHDDTTDMEYRLTYNDSHRDKNVETLMLSRGDREAHEYESGHLLRNGARMRVKKLPDARD
jgi:hypothetical protein